MLRLKATKTSLSMLVGQYEKLPTRNHVEFRKAHYHRSWWLEWPDGNNWAKAYFSTCAGTVLLSVTVTELGREVRRKVYRPSLELLEELGLTEEVVSAAERKRGE